MYKYAILSFGYAESHHASLIFMSRQYNDLEFETKDDLIKDISYCILKAYKEKYEVDWGIDECCEKSMDNGDKFCSECGRNVKTLGVVYKDDFNHYLRSLPLATADDIGMFFYELDWDIFVGHEVICSITKENSVFIYEAEKVIMSVLEDELA